MIHIERLEDSETVLSHLGHKAWVFKYHGGELIMDFRIFHRPAGKDQIEKVIYHRFGDDANRLNQDLAKENPQDGYEGYLIIAIPDSLNGKGEFRYSFSVNGSSSRGRVPATDVYPTTVTSHSGLKGGSMDDSDRAYKPVHLRPGETKTLATDYTGLTRGEPKSEEERLLYVLDVTALKDGQLPRREGGYITGAE
jgi:hypothetical protein